MELSVVLPICRDDGVAACLASIGEDVEVVVVLNGGAPGVNRRLLADKHCVVIEEPRLGLARACQIGVEAASHDAVLLMNSDCQFESGSIASLKEALTSGTEVVAGVMHCGGTGWQARLVDALWQAQRTDEVHAFQPNLLIDRRVAARIGGYLFDERLTWTEDADLHRRLTAAGVPTQYCSGSVVVHSSLSLCDYLRSAWKYGYGRAQAERWHLPGAGPLRLSPAVFATAWTRHRRRGGVPLALYGLTWSLVWFAGRRWWLARMRLAGRPL